MKRLSVIVLAIAFVTPLFAGNTPKEKISAGFDVLNREASVRFWAGDAIGFDASTGLSYVNDWTEFKLSGAAVFPMFSSDGINGNLVAGIGLGFGADKNDNVEHSMISVMAKAGLEFETILAGINKNLSIGSGVFFAVGAARTNTKTKIGNTTISTDETDISVGFIKDFTISPVIIRYYF